ncbi:glutathione S-transferase family protein [Fulvimarina sp. 2208YS6-2-32]|uniref:Glutathione S-transferase family protein n=1 Tax=Fulvimarina uroteuthidis TaxID=3098149 RepID=A0ABU5HX92_9HYPH|nr:glutathione S-transferase family protein [Fulvimarina sp. 2208YS6-2-32]MDY8107707.1 glutathione S-transferase family protein [Fulvimarina sp. 2208YS6-2-32]
MITVYGRADSNNVQPIMWLIGELGLDHERLDVGHRFGGTRTAEHLAMNPMGLVPVLRDDGDEPIAEMGAILRYLAARYGTDDDFWPADPSHRAQVDRWAEWAKVEVMAAFQAPVFFAAVIAKPEKRDPVALQSALAKLDVRLDVAEARLADRLFLAGDRFTLADTVFGSVLYRYFALDIARPERPNLSAYYHRLEERPAYRDHVMVSFDALKGTV